MAKTTIIVYANIYWCSQDKLNGKNYYLNPAEKIPPRNFNSFWPRNLSQWKF